MADASGSVVVQSTGWVNCCSIASPLVNRNNKAKCQEYEFLGPGTAAFLWLGAKL